MSAVAASHIPSVTFVDNHIIEGRLGEALDVWENERQGISEYEFRRDRLVHIRERIEYLIEHNPASLSRSAEAVKRTLTAFLRQARVR